MIEATVLKEQDSPVGVRVLNHGDPIVCSAVSILMLNCANSIEEFTDAGFTVDIAPDGGDMTIKVTEFDELGKAQLLLDSLILGLKSIEIRYSEQTKSIASALTSNAHLDLTFYFSKFHDQINECERLCTEKKKLEVTYVLNEREFTIICSPKEIKYQNRKVCFSVFNQLSRQVFDIPIDNIICIKQLPTVSTVKEVSMSVVYKLKGRLAESYKLKEWEYSNGYDPDGNLIVINANEDHDVLLSRLIKYAQNCVVMTPKFMRDRMSELIYKVLENYEN